MNEPGSVLECQACGYPLRNLSPSEEQRVADNPYNFVFFCSECKKSGAHIEPMFEDQE